MSVTVIKAFMREHKLKGKPNKYVVLISSNPAKLISRDKVYLIHDVDWSKLELPMIVHKRDLRKYVSPVQARLFWRYDGPTRN